MEEYGPNSYKSKEEKKEAANVPEKKVGKVIAGSAKSKKKGEMQKFADVFISEDVGNVKSYIFMEVIVPAIKKAISDVVTNGIDMILYGESGRSRKISATTKVSCRRNIITVLNRGGHSRELALIMTMLYLRIVVMPSQFSML